MKYNKYFFLLLSSFFFFSGCSFLPQQPQESMPIPTSQNTEFSYEKTEEYNQTDNYSDEQQEFLTDEQNTAIETKTYRISNIIDGDTLYVIVDGKERKIRIMGIDTPEKQGGFRPEACFGDHASDYAKTFLKGKRVSLLESKTGDTEDKYGRWLRYVFVDGQDFGAHLITKGYAEHYDRFQHDRKIYYQKLERQSQKDKRGMWNSENCEYWKQMN